MNLQLLYISGALETVGQGDWSPSESSGELWCGPQLDKSGLNYTSSVKMNRVNRGVVEIRIIWHTAPKGPSS